MRIVMNTGGNAEPYLGPGWSVAEPDLTWATGPQSVLSIPTGTRSHTCLLRLYCWPYVQPGFVERQRLVITVGDLTIGSFELRAKRVLVAVIPRNLVAGTTNLQIVLHHPDTATPKDFPEGGSGDDRSLSFAYTAIELDELDAEAEALAEEIRVAVANAADTQPGGGPGDAAAMALSKLQSIGDDCELGFVQRHYKLEPLGVFRFASIGIDHVTMGIRRGLADFAEPDNLSITEHLDDPAHDYAGHETKYDVRYHTMRYPGEISSVALHTSETQRLRYLARKFMGDLARANHLFVVKRKEPLHPEEIALLLSALRQRGPSALLWVCEAGEDHVAGSAAYVMPGLLRGYVQRIDASPLKKIEMASWAEMAQGACAVWQSLAAPAMAVDPV